MILFPMPMNVIPLRTRSAGDRLHHFRHQAGGQTGRDSLGAVGLQVQAYSLPKPLSILSSTLGSGVTA